MDFQFRCTSISHFDKAAGQYQPCGQLLEASLDQVGLRVRCPGCQQMTVVPSPAMVGAATRQPQSKNGGGKRDHPDRGAAPGATATAAGSLAYEAFSSKTRCRKCGALLDGDGKCTACYYVVPAMRPVTTPIDQIPIQPAGFQLWFRNIMSDGGGIRVFEIALHSLFALTILVALGAAFGLAASGTVLVVCGLAAVTGLYVLAVWRIKRLGHVPAAPLPLFLRPLWFAVLVLARMQQWQRYDSRLANRVIIDVRGKAFGDRDLLDLEELPVCQVLDADGTDLTDAGLAHMHGLKNLRCLVVRRTHVTREGVFRLQQALPRCWIWS